MSVQTYSHLEDAIKAVQVSNTSLYVFAVDHQVKDCKFKKYLVGSLSELHVYISHFDVSAYEVITKPNVFLYLDIEIANCFRMDGGSMRNALDNCLRSTASGLQGSSCSYILDIHEDLCNIYETLANRPLDDAEMGMIGELLCKIMKTYIEKVFGIPALSQVIDIYSACRPEKLSFHFISRYYFVCFIKRDVIFDYNHTSMVFFVFEFIQFYRTTVWNHLLHNIRMDDENMTLMSECRPLLAALNLKEALVQQLDPMQNFLTPVDLAPYSRNQCFRLLGCGKNSQYRLFEWHYPESVFRDFYSYHFVVPSPKELLLSLVTGPIVLTAVDSGKNVFVISPHKYPRGSARIQSAITNPNGECCWPASVPRWNPPNVPTYPPPSIDHTNPPLSNDPTHPPPSLNIYIPAPENNFIDDTVEFMTDSLGKYYSRGYSRNYSRGYSRGIPDSLIYRSKGNSFYSAKHICIS